MYDTKLVNAAQHGDEAAFAALYDRNAEGVYDLCFALVGDVDEASRLTALVFTLAAKHLADISDASQVRPWLLAITRDRMLAEEDNGTLRFGWGAEASDGEPPGAPVSVEPLGTNELRRWVREAAAVLALADQVVVELGTRYDLDADQLTAAIGCPPRRLESIVAQVEQEAEQVLGSLILARQGRKDCKRLATLTATWDGHPSVEIADIADRHAATCERCRRRRALVSSIQLLAAAPAYPPPPDLRAQVLEQAAVQLPKPDAVTTAGGATLAGVAAAGDARPSPAGPARPGLPAGGFVPAGGPGGGAPVGDTVAVPSAGLARDRFAVSNAPPDSDRPWGLIAAVGAAVIVLIIAVVLVLRSSSSPTKLASTPTPATATVAPGTTTATTIAAAPVTIAPLQSTTIASTVPAVAGSQLSLNTTSVDFGTDATSAQVVLADTGAGQAGWHATSPVPWLTIAPPSGFLQPSGQVQVTFDLDRTKAPNGPFHVTVSFVPSDATGRSASLAVVGTNTQPTTTTKAATTTTSTVAPAGPVISAVSASPASIETTPCPTDQSVVSATVTDPAGVASVVVDYTLPGGSAGTATMTRSGSTWSASIGASATKGTITYNVRATGSEGLTTTSPTATITVATCPI